MWQTVPYKREEHGLRNEERRVLADEFGRRPSSSRPANRPCAPVAQQFDESERTGAVGEAPARRLGAAEVAAGLDDAQGADAGLAQPHRGEQAAEAPTTTPARRRRRTPARSARPGCRYAAGRLCRVPGADAAISSRPIEPGWLPTLVFAAVLMTGAILLSAAGTHTEIGRLPKASPTRTSLSGTLHGLRTAFSNRAFRMLLLTGSLSNANLGLIFALSTYFNTFLWGFGSGALAIFTVTILFGVAVAFAFATTASRRWGKRLVAVWCSLGYLIVATTPLLLRLAGASRPTARRHCCRRCWCFSC